MVQVRGVRRLKELDMKSCITFANDTSHRLLLQLDNVD